jgi:hypothetical protein
MGPSPYRADVEWKLGALTVLRRAVISADLREKLESLEAQVRGGGGPDAWTELSRACELALAESAERLAAPKDVVTSLLHADDDPRRLQLFMAIPSSVPDVEIVGAEDGFVALGRAELARWLLDADLHQRLTAVAEIEPRIAIGDGDACISWMGVGTKPDPALDEVTRILRSVRDRLVVE